MTRTTLLLSLFLILAVGGIIFFGIPTGTAPMRVPTITVDLKGPNGPPRCDGSFTADVTVKATYPVIPGQNPFPAKVVLTFNTNSNISTYTTTPSDTQVTFRADGEKTFGIQGVLKECAAGDGSITANASITLLGQAGHHPPTVVSDGPIIIPKPDVVVEAYPNSIYSNTNGVFISDPADPSARIVTIKCCAAGTFRYRFPRSSRHNIIRVTADERRFNCVANQVKSSTIEGKRNDSLWEANFVTTIQKLRGNTCRVGRSVVE